MVLRFYRGGPVAVRGNLHWLAADDMYGCVVAKEAGVRIPPSTYLNADPEVSQFPCGRLGLNYTALLPIEE